MTINSADIDLWTIKVPAEIPCARICLRCGSTFWSEDFGERICSRCEGSAVWRSTVYEGSGQGRRRSGERSS